MLRSLFYIYLQYDPKVIEDIDSIKHFLDDSSMITYILLFSSQASTLKKSDTVLVARVP